MGEPRCGPEVSLRERVERLSLSQKVRLPSGDSFWTLPAEPSIGLRPVVMSDGPVGVRGVRYDEREPSACLPCPTSLASSFDESLAAEVGNLLAAEARAKGIDVVLTPVLNLQRDPRGGRHFECFSEDPLVVSRLGAAVIGGLQSAGVGACAKHFVANDSETERFTYDVVARDDVLREIYLAPFEAAVRAGVWRVMAAYNSVGGSTMTESPLLRDVLKGEWGFDGPVVSDWFAARSLASADQGMLDLVMPGPSDVWAESLVGAVEAGSVAHEAIDDKVLRLLRLAARVGALDGIEASGEPETYDEVALLRRASCAGTVLLKNEPALTGEPPLLPFDASIRSMALIGANAHRARVLGGGSAIVAPRRVVSAWDGLRGACGDAVVRWAPGVSVGSLPEPVPADLLRCACGEGGG